MKYSEMHELVNGLRAMADFYEKNIHLNVPYRVTVTEYATKYKRDEKGEYVLDPEATKAIVAKYAKAMKPAEKSYGDDFTLTKNFSQRVRLQVSSNRAAVCTPKVIGTRILPAEPERVIEAKPERTEEIVEWECHDALLAS